MLSIQQLLWKEMMFTVVERDDVDISCFASANPLPSDITWSFDGQMDYAGQYMQMSYIMIPDITITAH